MRVRVAAAAAAGLLTLTACADDSKPGATTSSSASATPTARQASSTQLKAALFVVGDLPTGWTVEPDDGDDDGDEFASGCKELAALDAAFNDETGEEASFSRGQFGPFLSQGVSSLPSADEVTKRLAALKTATEACTSFQYKDEDGDTQKVRIAPTSFPTFGDETFSTRITVEFQGGRIAMTVVAVRLRNHVVMVSGTSVTTSVGGGNIAPAELEKIVRAAVDKAERELP